MYTAIGFHWLWPQLISIYPQIVLYLPLRSSPSSHPFRCLHSLSYETSHLLSIHHLTPPLTLHLSSLISKFRVTLYLDLSVRNNRNIWYDSVNLRRFLPYLTELKMSHLTVLIYVQFLNVFFIWMKYIWLPNSVPSGNFSMRKTSDSVNSDRTLLSIQILWYWL